MFKPTMFTWYLYLFVVLTYFRCGQGFNVDIGSQVLFGGPRESKFGFTVDQYRANNTNWVLVGAPEDDSQFQRDLHKPGAVYLCQSTDRSCHQIQFDNQGNEYIPGTFTPIHNKSQQWFGATLSSSSEYEYILACGPRRTHHGSQGLDRDPLGVCYLKSHEKVTEYNPCKRVYRGNYKFIRSCQAGMSSRILSRDEFAVGAPGAYDWQGDIIVQSIENQLQVKGVVGRERRSNSYLGFAVDIGEFTGDSVPDLIASMPRYSDGIGIISINLMVKTFLTQDGEYFGYSLAVSDFNNDGLDDVAVGAPFYADLATGAYETGRVFMLYQTPQHEFRQGIIYGDLEMSARFGLSVSSLGNIDGDLYNDLVVGAPYGGQESRGVIYIFQGGPQGILADYSQKISALEINPSISGFGFSVKGGMDQDGNKYPDVVVGAYVSGHAVLLRSRPVLTVNVTLLPSPSRVSLDHVCLVNGKEIKSCFTLSTCLSHVGRNIPDVLSLQGNWFLDAEKKNDGRVYFRGGGRRKLHLVTTNKQEVAECVTDYILFKDTIIDKLTPIMITFEYKLVQSGKDELQPILNHYQPRTHRVNVDIGNTCGADQTCIPNLTLDLFSPTKEYVFGRQMELEVGVLVRNLGEESHETRLYLKLPPGVSYINVATEKSNTTVSCLVLDAVYQTLVCNLGNPLRPNNFVHVYVRMSPHSVPSSAEQITFDAVINSTNPENATDVHDNRKQIDIGLAIQIDITATGVSLPEQLLYNSSSGREIKSEADIGPLLKHRYVVTNNGPSALSNLSISIYWPEMLPDGSVIAYVTNDLTVHGPGICHVQLLDIDNITSKIYNLKENEDVVHVTVNETSKDDDVNKYTLHCFDDRKLCKKISCTLGPMQASESVMVDVHSRIVKHSMTNLLKTFREVFLYSLAEAVVTSHPYDHVILDDVTVHQTKVWTLVAAVDIGAGSTSVSLWVIILAAAAGALMLALLIVGLHKCGFFKRKLGKPFDGDEKSEDKISEKQEADL